MPLYPWFHQSYPCHCMPACWAQYWGGEPQLSNACCTKGMISPCLFWRTWILSTLLRDVIRADINRQSLTVWPAKGEATPLKMPPQAAVPTPPVRSPLVQSMIEEVRGEVLKALREGCWQRSDVQKMLDSRKITDSQAPSIILTKVKTVFHGCTYSFVALMYSSWSVHQCTIDVHSSHFHPGTLSRCTGPTTKTRVCLRMSDAASWVAVRNSKRERWRCLMKARSLYS